MPLHFITFERLIYNQTHLCNFRDSYRVTGQQRVIHGVIIKSFYAFTIYKDVNPHMGQQIRQKAQKLMSGKSIMQTSLWSRHFMPSTPAAAVPRRLCPSPSTQLVFGSSVHLFFGSPGTIVTLPSSGQSFTVVLEKGRGKNKDEKGKLKLKEEKGQLPRPTLHLPILFT